jgi:tetratricopeptide (TPR) repeat protein
MKRLIFLIAFVVNMALTTYAQNNGIQLYLYAPNQMENIPEASMDYLLNNLSSAVTADGLTVQNEYMTQFVLMPKVNVASKSIITNTQTQVVLNIDISLQVVDGMNGTLYASSIVNVKGVGTNETKAYNSAFRSINKKQQQIVVLVKTAKQKILSYYEAEADNIIKKANLLATKNNYEEAFYLLSMIPSQCSKFDASISAGLSLWEKYKNYSCNTNLAKAEAIWISGQDYNAAIEAGKDLSQILPDSECYGKAIQLYNEIKKKVEDLWKFEMKQYDTESELKKAKILAFQAIGVAYGRGQQPKVIVKNSMF